MRILLSALLGFCLASPANAAAKWWNDAVFYEIFTRSFQDSNGDGIGDLNGITSRLDYLNSLGINGIWLTPIFKSPSYHGYDTVDYKSIQPDFGNPDDFKELIRQAHQRGIKVILDMAFNHTSPQHPWFTSQPDYYCWRSEDPHWPGKSHWFPLNGQYYYGFFGPKMPDLNWNTPAVMAEVKGTLHYWADLGVDGFRLDAVRYYVEGPQGESDTPGTHNVLREFIQDLKASYPDVLFVGEVWADPQIVSTYVNNGQELDLAFDFPVSFGLVSSLQSGQASALALALQNTRKRVTDPARLAPIVTNHDMVRVASQVGPSLPKLKLAATVLLTLPGTPFIYYGEEIGLPDSSAKSDLGKRTPMQWTASPNHGFTSDTSKPWLDFSSSDPQISVSAQLGVKGTLLHYYQRLIQLRQNEPSLRRGDLQMISTSDPGLLAYARQFQGKTTVTVMNFGSNPVYGIALNIPAQALTVLWGEIQPTIQDGTLRIPQIAAQSSAIIRTN